MSVAKIIYTNGGISTIYKPHPRGFVHGEGEILRTDWAWPDLVEYFKNLRGFDIIFIQDKPINKEDWL